MATGGLDEFVNQSAARLRENARDPKVVERLREHPVLYEVLGRWPPDTALRYNAAELDLAITVTQKAAEIFAEAAPGDPLLAEFHLVISRLHETAAKVFIRPDFIADVGVEEAEAGNEPPGIVGRWPPD